MQLPIADQAVWIGITHGVLFLVPMVQQTPLRKFLPCIALMVLSIEMDLAESSIRSIEMDLAESRISSIGVIKRRGAEIFRKINLSLIL
jgi:hypothetical protein